MLDSQWKELQADILDRCGLKWEWQRIDAGTKLDIRKAWESILERPAQPEQAQDAADALSYESDIFRVGRDRANLKAEVADLKAQLAAAKSSEVWQRLDRADQRVNEMSLTLAQHGDLQAKLNRAEEQLAASEATKQHTICAVCMKDKPTPLKLKEGYVCLACIDHEIDRLRDMEARREADIRKKLMDVHLHYSKHFLGKFDMSHEEVIHSIHYQVIMEDIFKIFPPKPPSLREQIITAIADEDSSEKDWDISLADRIMALIESKQ